MQVGPSIQLKTITYETSYKKNNPSMFGEEEIVVEDSKSYINGAFSILHL